MAIIQEAKIRPLIIRTKENGRLIIIEIDRPIDGDGAACMIEGKENMNIGKLQKEFEAWLNSSTFLSEDELRESALKAWKAARYGIERASMGFANWFWENLSAIKEMQFTEALLESWLAAKEYGRCES